MVIPWETLKREPVSTIPRKGSRTEFVTVLRKWSTQKHRSEPNHEYGKAGSHRKSCRGWGCWRRQGSSVCRVKYENNHKWSYRFSISHRMYRQSHHSRNCLQKAEKKKEYGWRENKSRYLLMKSSGIKRAMPIGISLRSIAKTEIGWQWRYKKYEP